MNTWIGDLIVVFLFPMRANCRHLFFARLKLFCVLFSYGLPWPSCNIYFLIFYSLSFISTVFQMKGTWWKICVAFLPLHVCSAHIYAVPLTARSHGKWLGSNWELNIEPVLWKTDSQICHFNTLWLVDVLVAGVGGAQILWSWQLD